MKAITTNSFYAWILAARPKTLTGAVIPVLIGSSLAFADGKFDIIPALLCVLFACGMQIAANFINDLYDYLKGSDRADRLGPERACAQGWITPIAMKRGIAGTLIFSCLMGCALLQQCWGRLPHGGWELILLGLLCVIFAFLYTTILSYQGWGRPTRIGFLRLHPRRRNLLRTGPCHYGRRMGSLAHLRPGNRHLTGRKQLPRPGTGRSQRQAHTDCPLRRTFRPLPVSGIRHSSRLAQPMVCLQR